MARPHEDPPSASRAQRSLAVMAGTVIGVCVLAIVALLIARGAGVPDSAFHTGVLAVVQVLPLPGLVIGLLLALATIAVGVVARTRGH